MSPEQKAALLKRLADGRAKVKAARADAKEKGHPDPKPRKARAKKVSEAGKQALMAEAHQAGREENAKRLTEELAMKRAKKNKDAEVLDKKEAVVDPMANKPAREEIAPIDGAPADAKNVVAAMPPAPEANVTSKIDVPNLPDKKGRKKIVEDAEDVVEAKSRKGISTTGKPEKYDDNVIIRSEETGNQAIPAQYPGQEESIRKLLKKSKMEDRPLAPKSVPDPPMKTVKNVFKHVPDLKAVEGRTPFSFAAIRKQLYQ